MKKKTFVFDDDMIRKLNELKEKLNKKEIAIIKEALNMYYEYQSTGFKAKNKAEELVDKIDFILNKVEELSYKLGKCHERNKYLEKELKSMNKR